MNSIRVPPLRADETAYTDLLSPKPVSAQRNGDSGGGAQQRSLALRTDRDAERDSPSLERREDSRDLVTTGGRSVAPTARPDETGKPGPGTPAARIETAKALTGLDVDVRAMTPRQMSDFAFELYATAVISWDEYAELAFQPELHPDYDRTVGALTGEAADPDRPRDMVRLWEDRSNFERRYNTADSPRVRLTERIASVLERIADSAIDLSV